MNAIVILAIQYNKCNQFLFVSLKNIFSEIAGKRFQLKAFFGVWLVRKIDDDGDFKHEK